MSREYENDYQKRAFMMPLINLRSTLEIAQRQSSAMPSIRHALSEALVAVGAEIYYHQHKEILTLIED